MALPSSSLPPPPLPAPLEAFPINASAGCSGFKLKGSCFKLKTPARSAAS
jgi:hypothetical protein